MSCRFLILYLLAAGVLSAEWPREVLDGISQVGNTDDESLRQSTLAKMAALPSLNETQRKEATSLADFARRWNQSGLKFYGASVRGKPHRTIGDYDFGVANDSPLTLSVSCIAGGCWRGL